MRPTILQVGNVIEQLIAGRVFRTYKVVRTTKTQAIAESVGGMPYTMRFRIATYMGGIVAAVGGQERNVTYIVREE